MRCPLSQRSSVNKETGVISKDGIRRILTMTSVGWEKVRCLWSNLAILMFLLPGTTPAFLLYPAGEPPSFSLGCLSSPLWSTLPDRHKTLNPAFHSGFLEVKSSAAAVGQHTLTICMSVSSSFLRSLFILFQGTSVLDNVPAVSLVEPVVGNISGIALSCEVGARKIRPRKLIKAHGLA